MTGATARPGSGEMFDGIAGRYDFINKLMSLGQDRGWRLRIARALQVEAGDHVLDLATGTADVALEIVRTCPGVEVTGLDPSDEMRRVGEEKVAAAGLADRVRLVAGDAQALPWEAGTFAGCCISFGIRNVPDRARALAEMNRVTRTGGRVVVLEAGEPRSGLMAPLARFHIHHIMPAMGAMLSGAPEYRYLQQSIEAFPSADAFMGMMTDAGLQQVAVKHLCFGSIQLYTGVAS